ncbi:MAG: FIST N-terminal domain-containing protein [Geminicoccaceae bacterium]
MSESAERMPAATGLASGFTDLPRGEDAAAELKRQLAQPGLELVLVFCSPEYRDTGFAPAVQAAFGDVPVIGCTTSGEVTPEGYRNNGIAALSFAAPDFHAEIGRFPGIQNIDIARCSEEAGKRLAALDAKTPGEDGYENLGLVLIDALSRREEALMSCLDAALGRIPLFGASAGDGLRFEETSVLADGTFESDGAVLALLRTNRPFKVFRSQHFVASDVKMVVTDADPEKRIVKEINAEPAVEEYARITGVGVDELTPMHFATHPLVVRLGGAEYVRSIQKANPDGSLSFYCAIDEGLVLTLAEGRDMISGLEQLFVEIEDEIGEPEAVLAFDCVLRRLELEHMQQLQRIPPIFARHNVTGFSTFGEQFASMHVNQTFTGLAIGARTRA